MKRLFTFLICSAIMLAGCSSGSNKETMNSITVWHWMTDRQSAFEELAERYEKLTGIDVVFELYAPWKTYLHKVQAAGDTDSLPDIFGILGEKKEFASFINADHIANLSSNMKADNNVWHDKFFEKALGPNSFKEGNQYSVPPGIYAVPIDITNIQMLYNRKLFKAAGLDPDSPPDTWQDFLSVSSKIKESGSPVFVCGFGETWLVENFAMNFAVNIMGLDKVLDTFRGKVSYSDPDWIKVFSLFEDMYKQKLILPDSVTMVNKISEQTFAMEKAAFSFNGSWCVNVYKEMNPDLDYFPILPPKVEKDNPMVIWGGPGSSFVVNKKSRDPQRAINFLKWLTDEEQQVFLSEDTFNLPANKDSLKSIKNPVLKKFAEGMYYTTHPSIWPIEENTRVQEVMAKGIQNILTGEKTADEVAAMVANIKESINKRRK